MQMRVVRQKGTYMLIRDAIGCFTQIECSEVTVQGPLLSKLPVRSLISESDEGREGVTPLDTFYKGLHQSLLAVLHDSRLYRNHSGRLERLWYESDLNRPLAPRFEEFETREMRVPSPVGENVFPGWKVFLKPSGPFELIKLPVSPKFVSSGPRPMLGYEFAVVDLSVYFGEQLPEQGLPCEAVILGEPKIEPCIGSSNFLLTLEVVLDRSRFTLW
jgi:hypothetical protein